MHKTGYLSPYLLPSLAGCALFYFVSFAESIYYAFTAGIARRHFVGFGNFRELTGNPSFWLAVKNTLLFLLPGALLLLALALWVSWLLADGGCEPVLYMLLVPVVIPSSAWLPGLRQVLEAKDGNLLQEQAFFILMAVYLLRNLGYLAVILYGAIREMPAEFREIWLLEKKTGVSYLWNVVLPVIRPSVFFCLILAVMGCLKIYRESWLLFGDTPPLSVYMFQYFLNNNFEKLNYQRLSAAALLLILALTIFIGAALYGGKVEKE